MEEGKTYVYKSTFTERRSLPVVVAEKTEGIENLLDSLTKRVEPRSKTSKPA